MAIKSFIKQRYIRAMLDSYWPFLSYIGIFVAIFIFAALSIRVDVIRTYNCLVNTDNGKTYLKVDTRVKDDIEHMYIYTQKNIEIHKVNNISLTYTGDSTYIQIEANTEFERFLSESKNRTIHVDIPQGSISLLKRMIPLGESSR